MVLQVFVRGTALLVITAWLFLLFCYASRYPVDAGCYCALGTVLASS